MSTLAAVQHFIRTDTTLAALAAQIGPYEPTAVGAGFRTLARAIIGQQVSVAAAAAIESRASVLIGDWQPQLWLNLGYDGMRRAGLSAAKITAINDIAQRCSDGRLDFTQLAACDDESVIAQLIEIRGIGRWTAEIYLIEALGRPDVLPANDLGIRDAYRLAYHLPELPSEQFLRQVTLHWRPYRSAAAWYLWRARRTLLMPQKEPSATAKPWDYS